MKLDEIRISSFITSQQKNLRGGTETAESVAICEEPYDTAIEVCPVNTTFSLCCEDC